MREYEQAIPAYTLFFYLALIYEAFLIQKGETVMEYKGITREWDTLKKDAMERAKNAAPYVKEGKIVDAKDTVALLEAVIKPFDKVNIEGNNQKQADFLAKCLCQVDPAKVHDLHMVQSVLTLPEHLEDNIKTFTGFQPLSNAERETIAQAVKAYHNTGAVACTNCKYCMPCPAGVNIPRIFGLYNSYKSSGDYWRGFNRIYAEFDPDMMASACVNCGACVKKCPQHINIPEELKKIHAEYEARTNTTACFRRGKAECPA